VGERVRVFSARGAPALDLTFGGEYSVVLTSSGTEALALALELARGTRPRNEARVLLPGYACPNLVAASFAAGLVPIPCDIHSEKPFLSPASVTAAVKQNCAAVVAPHFLGLRHPLSELDEIARAAGALLVEDGAQMLVSRLRPRASLVVLSFGRGKPLSILHGGALLARTTEWGGSVAGLVSGVIASSPSGTVRRLARRLAYNLAIGPTLYPLVASLPGLGVGVVRYSPLVRGERPSVGEIRLLAGGGPSSRSRDIVRQLRALVARYPGKLADLTIAEQGTEADLLRYPVLADQRESRDRLLAELNRAGIGASALYACALPDIEGIPPLESQALPNARDFAGRLLTLPVHSGVNARHLRRVEGVLQRCLASARPLGS
jgi:dTDP-4-amino-4,6-dideoxygalactose transaminase